MVPPTPNHQETILSTDGGWVGAEVAGREAGRGLADQPQLRHHPFREQGHFPSTLTVRGLDLDLTSKENCMSHLFVTNCFPASEIQSKALHTQAKLCLCSLQLFEPQDFWLLVTLPFSETQPSIPMEMAFSSLPFWEDMLFRPHSLLP